MNQKFEKFEKWLETIRYEVTDLVRSKHIFWKLRDIVKSNPKIQKPNSFYKFAGDTYIAYSVMGVRRQIKHQKGSISFAGLLQEIVETPCVLSRERFARADAKNVDTYIVQQDLHKLKKLGHEVENFADKRIAHYDKRLIENVPLFGELDTCIDFLAELTEKYWLLFKSVDIRNDWVPTPIEDYWEEIFRQPWIPPGTPNKSIDTDPLGMY
jgi:hypothetical protein